MAPRASSPSSSNDGICEARDVYLTSEERYQVWTVKAAERPVLLTVNSCQGELDNDEPLPLTDGCDIEGWRASRVIDVEESARGVLNVGQGCPLLRLESQVPLPTNASQLHWDTLRQQLFRIQRPQQVSRIHYSKDMGLYCWFERDNVPVIMDGCTEEWKAAKSCRFASLVERFGSLEWRFSDTHAETMTLRTYQRYIDGLEGRTDDAPLAVYDSQFAFDCRHVIEDEYSVPACFDADLFSILDEDLRPPWRWILIGPARSGTGLHIDPVGTHAWVTLLEGCKRWVLFPAGTDPASIHMQQPQIPSVLWFRDYYHHVMLNHPIAVEIVQYPGETVYVPSGWPHLVLNLELSTAITHNYASEFPSMSRLWQAVVEAEPDMAAEFKARLEVDRPDLAAQCS